MPSFERPNDPNIAPSPWILRWAHLVPRGGQVLDLACGHGRHAVALAAMGHRVVAADIDVAALPALPGIAPLAVDLETGVWPFAGQTFAGIVMTNYCHRPHFPHLIDSLADGGVLLIETFGQGNENYGRPRNPDFLLAPGELLRAFDRLQVVAYEHGAEQVPRPAVRQRICAIKGASLATLS